MKPQSALNGLVPLNIILAVIAAGTGIFYPSQGNSFLFTTVRGEVVEIWGQGWYRYDTPIAALGFTATDLVTLFLATPILAISFILYRRNSLRAGLMLAGVLAYFIYNYTSMGFGAAYNRLFLVYILIFSASLFGLILTLVSFDLSKLPTHFDADLPRKGIGIFLIFSGIILALVWLVLSILPALIQNTAPPEAYYYTTFITATVDIGIISPALIMAGILLLRRVPLGYLLAASLLIFTSILGPNLTAGGVIQVLKGVITVNQALVFTVPFVLLSLIAIGLTFRFLMGFSETR